ncbi:MAG TPA: sulfurtransferase-like selenium metabolism protein YedF [Desulfobulbaceae bacterium]|nr:sulfurtransferase-like selenium metabolism protein YedF [Desulfobulbaceae bacterium]
MEITMLDCKGLACPQPVIQTKEALESGTTRLRVIVDNEASRDNVARFVRSRGGEVKIQAIDRGCFQLMIQVESTPAQQSFDPADYSCPIPTKNSMVYVISSDSMGRGSDELGWALLQTYLQTIEQVDPLPTKIIFYNAGVKLVTRQSGALDALLALQKRGVEILACGTCLDFFQLKSEIQVGHISNMYDIMAAMSEADKVVSPF